MSLDDATALERALVGTRSRRLLTAGGLVAAGAAASITVVSVFSPSRLVYEPKHGYIVAVSPTPKSLLTSDGWIAPEQMAIAVRTALQATLGLVDSNDTRPLTTWRNTTIGGTHYQAWGGEYVTEKQKLPQLITSVLDSSTAASIGIDDTCRFAVRYWTTRTAEGAPPGRMFMAIEMWRQTLLGEERVTDSAVLATSAVVVLDRIQPETPR